MRTIQAKVIVPGEAKGTALVSQMPLSFWGGVEPHSGEVIDVHHDLAGQVISGKVLLIPEGRGSCSGSGIMLEMIRLRTCPAALVMEEAEPIISLGSVMGYELYHYGVPIYTVSKAEYESISTGDTITAGRDGTLSVEAMFSGEV